MKNAVLAVNFTADQLIIISNCGALSGCSLTPRSLVTDLEQAKSELVNGVEFAVVLFNASGTDKEKIDDFLNLLNKPNMTCDIFADEKTQVYIESKTKTGNLSTINYFCSTEKDFEANVKTVFSSLIPDGLKNLCMSAATYIGQIIFPGLDFSLKEGCDPKFHGDFLVYCEIVDLSLFGAVTLRINSSKIHAVNDFYKELSQDLLLDTSKEFLNQLLGALNLNLVRYLDVEPKVAIPMALSNQVSRPKVLTGAVFKPAFTCQDSNDILEIRFEFRALNKRLHIRSLANKKIEFLPPEDTAEFF